MVTRFEFNRIKKENPESRIGQRTWKQQQYRNRLYKTLNKGLKKSDADAILTKEKFDKEKKTWEYISSKYGTTKEGALQMIKKGYGNLVVDHFNEFSGLDKECAMLALDSASGYTKRSLYLSIVENADKISGLDKEFFDLYLQFKIYESERVTCGYGMRTATRTRWNPIGPLLDNIKFIEGVDEKLLLDHCLNLINSYQNEFEGRSFHESDPERERASSSSIRVQDACVSFVTKATIKIPETVWKRVDVIKCFYKSELDFSTFFGRLEGFDFYDYINIRGVSEIFEHDNKDIPADMLKAVLIKIGHLKHVGDSLKIPSIHSSSCEEIYPLILRYFPLREALACFYKNNLGDWKDAVSWVRGYFALHPEEIRYFEKQEIKEALNEFDNWHQDYSLSLLMSIRERYEKQKLDKEKEEKKQKEREKINLEKQKIEEDIKKDYSYGIELFLGGGKYADYVKNLLLRTKVNGSVSKNEFHNLYHKLTPEEQKKLLKLFRKVELS